MRLEIKSHLQVQVEKGLYSGELPDKQLHNHHATEEPHENTALQLGFLDVIFMLSIAMRQC